MSHLAVKDQLKRLRAEAAALAGAGAESARFSTAAPDSHLGAADNSPAIDAAGQIAPKRPWRKSALRFSPAWLVSAAVHALLVLVLGLTILPANKAGQWLGLELASRGADESDQLLEAPTIELPSDVQASSIKDIASARPQFALMEPSTTVPLAVDTSALLAGGGSIDAEVRSMVGDGSDLGLDQGAGGSGDGKADGDKPAGGNDYAIFYGSEARGSRFVYVVDASQSMTGLRFEKACGELMSSIVGLNARQRFYVIFFNTEEFPQFYPQIDKFLSTANSQAVDKLGSWLRNVRPMGGTNPALAVKRALELEPDAIFLLSDGEFDLRPTMAVIHHFNRARTVIHTIAFGSLAGQPMLAAIAEATGGSFRFVPLAP
jgi:hypothetical protein